MGWGVKRVRANAEGGGLGRNELRRGEKMGWTKEGLGGVWGGAEGRVWNRVVQRGGKGKPGAGIPHPAPRPMSPSPQE